MLLFDQRFQQTLLKRLRCQSDQHMPLGSRLQMHHVLGKALQVLQVCVISILNHTLLHLFKNRRKKFSNFHQGT